MATGNGIHLLARRASIDALWFVFAERVGLGNALLILR
jgi:hypothetical protein